MQREMGTWYAQEKKNQKTEVSTAESYWQSKEIQRKAAVNVRKE